MSGNGGVYGGLQPPVAPATVQPGQKIAVAILGGVGPFTLASQNGIGAITQLDERKFQWSIPLETLAQSDALIVTDSQGQQASTKVEIQTLTQPNSQLKFGKSAVQLGSLLLVGNLTRDYSEDVNPLCRESGSIQIFNQTGEPHSTLQPPTAFCHRFAYQLATDGTRVIASGIHSSLDAQNKVLTKAGAIIYKLGANQQLEQEQILISPNLSNWGWTSVGIRGSTLFLHYNARSTNRSMIEIYKLSNDGNWNLSQTLDFSLIPSANSTYTDPQQAVNAAKFAMDSGALIFHGRDPSLANHVFLTFIEAVNSQWTLDDILDPLMMLPADIKSLGESLMISRFEMRNNQIIFDANLLSAIYQTKKARLVILEKSNRNWKFIQSLIPPQSDVMANYFFEAHASKNFIVLHQPWLAVLAIYKLGPHGYELYVDLTDIYQANGFSKNVSVFQNRIIVINSQKATVYSLF